MLCAVQAVCLAVGVHIDGKTAVELTVTAEDRMQLESIARSQSLPAALSRRAQMILRLADGETNSAVARRYRVSRPTISLWRKRYAELGIAGCTTSSSRSTTPHGRG